MVLESSVKPNPGRDEKLQRKFCPASAAHLASQSGRKLVAVSVMLGSKVCHHN